MFKLKIVTLTLAAAVVSMVQPTDAQAGPLLDWLRGVRRGCCGQRATPQYGYYAQGPSVAAAAPSAAGLQPGQCMKTCNKTCSRTVVNYVPYTAYRTNWNRVPVTQYKPVTTSDPCTGCTMTCMKPCTTYTYQCQKVPYTTYRPVYRQEQYTVPVTTITNDCANGNCGGGSCDSCGGGGPVNNFSPIGATPTYADPNAYSAPTSAPAYPTPGYSSPTYSTPSSSVPADVTPSLATPSGTQSRLMAPSGTLTTGSTWSTQRPTAAPHTAAVPQIRTATEGVRPQQRQPSFLERLENQGASRKETTGSYRQADLENQFKPRTEMQSLRRRWSYSPVRMASNDLSLPATGGSDHRLKSINDAWEDVK